MTTTAIPTRQARLAPTTSPQSNPAYKARALARREQTKNSVPNDKFLPPRNIPILLKLTEWGWRPDTNNKGETYADTFYLQHMVADPSNENFLKTFRTYYRIWPNQPGRKPRTDGKPDTDRMTGYLRSFMKAFPGVVTVEGDKVTDLCEEELNWESILNQIVVDCKGSIAYSATVIDLQNSKLDRATGKRGPAAPTPTVVNVKVMDGVQLGDDKAPIDTSDDDDAGDEHADA